MAENGKGPAEILRQSRRGAQLLRKDYVAVSARHTGEWLNRLTSDTAVVAAGAVEILPGLVGTLVRLVSALAMIIALDGWFAYLLIPGGLLMILLTCCFRGVLKRLHKDVQERDGRLRVFLQERIGSLMIIRAFAAEAQTARGAEEARRLYGRMEKIGLYGASFTYPTDGAPAVLDGLDLEIRMGETVAFTGPSGCGKSTVLKLLMGLYPLDAGRRNLTLSGGAEPLTARHRRLFAYVPQGNALMTGTIREVVSFAAPTEAGNEKKLRRALTLACADAFVDDPDAALSLCDRVLSFSGGRIEEMEDLSSEAALPGGGPRQHSIDR